MHPRMRVHARIVLAHVYIQDDQTSLTVLASSGRSKKFIETYVKKCFTE